MFPRSLRRIALLVTILGRSILPGNVIAGSNASPPTSFQDAPSEVEEQPVPISTSDALIHLRFSFGGTRFLVGRWLGS